MHRKIAVVLIACAVIFAAEQSFAEEKPGFFKRILSWPRKVISREEKAPAKAAVKPAVKAADKKAAFPQEPKKEYTRSEMVNEVKDILDDEEEVLNFLPSVKKELDEKGQAVYIFDGVKLEELDDAALKKTFTKVRQEATRIRTERLNNQLDNIRRNQQLTDAANRRTAPIVPKVPALPPSVNIPRPTPVPPQAPRIPKTPTPPPAPPRR